MKLPNPPSLLHPLSHLHRRHTHGVFQGFAFLLGPFCLRQRTCGRAYSEGLQDRVGHKLTGQ